MRSLLTTWVFVCYCLGPSTGRQEVVAEYFAKCWLCSKGFPSPAVLREHLQNVHHESAAAIAAAMAALQQQQPSQQQQLVPSGGSIQPPSTSVAAPIATSTSSSSTSSSASSSSSATAIHQLQKHPHACLQCSATFAERDELERHELTHSPTAQVVIQSIRQLNRNEPSIV